MASWTKEEFLEFCNRCGVDPKKALKEGHVNLRPMVTGATMATITSKINRRKRATKAVSKLQDSLREQNQAVALDKDTNGQTEGMECPKVSFRVSIIGHRVQPIDPDNFAAGCKGIIDGIVRSRLITNDDWKTVEIVSLQRKVSTWGKEGTEILIEDLREPNSP